METFWEQTEQIQPRPEFEGEVKTDVAVIGGGLAGILTAYFLQKAGKKVIVLEADKIGGGQTKGTTAKITSQHGLFYHKMAEKLEAQVLRQYAQANEAAIRNYFNIVQNENIDCDLEECSSFLYSQEEPDLLKKEADAAAGFGISASFTTDTELPFAVKGAVRFDGQAKFHPLKFIAKLAEKLVIYENSRVEKIEDRVLTTARGRIEAADIVMAAHYPFLITPGYYFLRMHQERSYVVALREEQRRMEGMYYGIDQGGLSFRPAEGALLLGGAGHRTGEKSCAGSYDFLKQAAERYYPGSHILSMWSAQDCMTLDELPYIGLYSSDTPHLWVATGFKKWGMSTAMAAADILCDGIMGKTSPYAESFSPQRFHLTASMKNLMKEGYQAAKGLTKGLSDHSQERIWEKRSIPPKEYYNELPVGYGGIVEYHSERFGLYKAKEEEVYMVSIKCPHLGCELVWNPDDLSWDCPCHGSRFDYTGRRLDGPAESGISLTGTKFP